MSHTVLLHSGSNSLIITFITEKDNKSCIWMSSDYTVSKIIIQLFNNTLYWHIFINVVWEYICSFIPKKHAENKVIDCNMWSQQLWFAFSFQSSTPGPSLSTIIDSFECMWPCGLAMFIPKTNCDLIPCSKYLVTSILKLLTFCVNFP